MYRLKKNVPAFEVVDGKYAGRKYAHGQVYEDIPPEEAKKFETVQAQKKAAWKAPDPAAPEAETLKKPAPEGGKK